MLKITKRRVSSAAIVAITTLAGLASAPAAFAQSYATTITGTPGLAAYYRLDDTSGTAADASGHGYAAPLTTPYTQSVAGIPGGGGDTATLFSGTSNGTGYGRIPTGTLTTAYNGARVEDSFTIEYWLKTSNASQYAGAGQWYAGAGLVDGENGGVTSDFGTSLSGGQVLFGIGAGDTTIASPAATNLANGAWHLVDATWTNTTGAMNLYVDGVSVATSTAGTGTVRGATAASGMSFGEIQTGINPYQGNLDEIALYTAPLTTAQISAHYALGSAVASAAAPEPSALLLLAPGALGMVSRFARRRRKAA